MKRLAVLVAAGLLIPAAVAEAHVELKSVSPRKNSTRGRGPRGPRHVQVLADDRDHHDQDVERPASIPLRSSGLKRGNKRVLQAIPRSALRSGSYKVEWRALAPDGHRQSGSWSFRVQR